MYPKSLLFNNYLHLHCFLKWKYFCFLECFFFLSHLPILRCHSCHLPLFLVTVCHRFYCVIKEPKAGFHGHRFMVFEHTNRRVKLASSKKTVRWGFTKNETVSPKTPLKWRYFICKNITFGFLVVSRLPITISGIHNNCVVTTHQ